MENIFDNAVFDKISQGNRKKKHEAGCPELSFDNQVNEGLLDFRSVRSADAKVKIIQTAVGYNVDLSDPSLLFSMKSFLEVDNPGVQLEFSEDLLNFEPEEDLVYKSKIPLWVIKPIGVEGKVSIQRVWKR